MALVSSLFTAISGLRNHQTMLDTISNNVANVNTIGFKAGRVMFRDMLSQTLTSANGADAINGRGGYNPVQTGTGVALASIDTIQTQGSLQATGIATDIAMQGDGFFVVKNGSTTTYTRAGMFRFDSAGQLVDPTGSVVQGWMAQQNAANPLSSPTIDSSNPVNITGISVTAGSTLQPKETNNVALVGNLDAGSTYANCANSAGQQGTTQITVTDGAGVPVTTTYTVGQTQIPMTVYDSLGNKHTLAMTLTNLSGTQIPGAATGDVYDNNVWAWTVDTDPNDASVHLALDNTWYDDANGNRVRAASSGLVHFNTNGSLDYVVYSDRNGEHFGTNPAGTAGNAPNLPGGYAIAPAVPLPTSWQAIADADALNGATIGFEGAVVPGLDYAGDSINGPVLPALPTFDNPSWNDTGSLTLASLAKLPIVLVYQNVMPLGPTPTPPTATTAGTKQTLDIANSGTTEQWYVQNVDIDWGTVSTITAADFDRFAAAAAGDDAALDQGIAGDQADGHDYSINPDVLRTTWGLRDGLTQDTAGRWVVQNGVSIYIPEYTCYLQAQDGYSQMTLTSVSVDNSGILRGQFLNTDGQSKIQDLAQLAIANFANAAGLAKAGETHFATTANSGDAVISTANSGGRGSIVGGALEQSNVDLSKELTDMIVAQRGFEVNARLVTTSDRILDTLVNLGR